MLSELATAYLFLGGAGAGALVVLCFLELAQISGSDSYRLPRDVLSHAWILCCCLLIGGILCLLLDVGQPDRVFYLFTSPSFSALSIGAWALSISLVCALILTVRSLFDGIRLVRISLVVVLVIGIIVGGITATYTGALLSSMASVLLWQSWLLPIIFLLSSLSCGVACVLLAGAFSTARMRLVSTMKHLAIIDSVLIVGELICLVIWLGLAWFDDGTHAAVDALFTGSLAMLFWGGLITGGLAVPFVLERFSSRRGRQVRLMLTALLILVGGCALRFCTVGAGDYDVTQISSMLYGLSLGW